MRIVSNKHKSFNECELFKIEQIILTTYSVQTVDEKLKRDGKDYVKGLRNIPKNDPTSNHGN